MNFWLLSRKCWRQRKIGGKGRPRDLRGKGAELAVKIYPVIMAGGVGSRLWPVSRHHLPKQFQPLVTENTMFEETLLRLRHPSLSIGDPLVICNEAYRELVHDQAERSGFGSTASLLEPVGRNTAPVAIAASLSLSLTDPEGIILLLPADQHVLDKDEFARAVSNAATLAAEGKIATIGIRPDRPETGFGYIRLGEPISDAGARVDAFVEKPDLETAKKYVTSGQYAWNAGIFAFRADVLLAEAKQHAPDILEATEAAFAKRRKVAECCDCLDTTLFSNVRSDSIDYAIMEHTDKAAIVGPADMGWSDVGSWQAVLDLSEQTDQSEIVDFDCKNTHIRTSGPLVAAIGLENMIVVATGDTVLVAPADRSQDVKRVVEELKARGRTDLL